MKPGHYPDGAFVWHDVDYILAAVEQDTFGMTLEESLEAPTEWPHEAVLEDGGVPYGIAFLTLRDRPFPEDPAVEDRPRELSIHITRDQAIELRDWLSSRICATPPEPFAG